MFIFLLYLKLEQGQFFYTLTTFGYMNGFHLDLIAKDEQLLLCFCLAKKCIWAAIKGAML